jgi:hypothetical protein
MDCRIKSGNDDGEYHSTRLHLHALRASELCQRQSSVDFAANARIEPFFPAFCREATP